MNDCRYNIIRSFFHPNFRADAWYDDIALIEFDGPVKFSNCIRPACLPDTNKNSIASVIATGIDNDHRFPLMNQRLRKVEFVVQGYDECSKRHFQHPEQNLYRGVINRTQICAAAFFDRIGSCHVSPFFLNCFS